MKIKLCRGLFLAAAFVGGLPAPAQDAAKVAPDHYRILLENGHVRVIENTLAPGFVLVEVKSAAKTAPPKAPKAKPQIRDADPIGLQRPRRRPAQVARYKSI